jgi:putative ABC transport system permease protein
MLLEGVLVGSVAFLLATTAAPAVSKGIAGYLVEYQQVQQADEEQKNSDMVLTGNVENDDESEVVGVTAAITGIVILLSGISVLGIIVAAISLACIPVVVQNPRDIL